MSGDNSNIEVNDEQTHRIISFAVSLVHGMTPNKKPSILYHYTNGDGLVGILPNHSLWATHVSYMNDMEEYIAAVKILRDMAGNMIADNRLSNDQRALMHYMVERLTMSISHDAYRCFVVCFSAAENRLSQWRGYSGNQNKFAIGFDPIHLEFMAKEHAQPDANGIFRCLAYLSKVEYDLNKHTQLISSILNWAVKQYPIDLAESMSSNIVGYRQNWVEKFLQYVSMIAPLIKNKQFDEEEEWRIIIMPYDENWVHYRNRGSLLTPYLDLDLRCGRPLYSDRPDIRDPVRNVWIGPSPHMAENIKAVTHMLLRYGYHHANAIDSKTPYRNL